MYPLVMALGIPPGLEFISKLLIALLLSAISIITVERGLKSIVGHYVPTWILHLASISLLPAALVASIRWQSYKDERAARSVGAVLPPTVRSRWPAALDVLIKMVKDRHTEYLGHTFERWSEEYGPVFNMRFFYKNRFFTTEPEFIKSIHATNFAEFERGPFLRQIQEAVFGKGVFASDGDLWRFHRSMTRPFFSKERLSHFEIFHRHAEDIIAQMKVRFSQQNPVDIQDAMMRFTMDSATEFLFGADVRSLSAGLSVPPGVSGSAKNTVHSSDAFSDAFLAAEAALARRIRIGPAWPLAEFWEDEVKKHMAVVNSFVEPIIERVLNAKGQKSSEEGGDEDTLLGNLVQLTDDKVLIRDETLNILLAGRDTTATTLTFAVYLLSQHPEIYSRLREEILTKLGSSGRPTPDDLRDLKYLKAVINETLRLFPPVPYHLRCSRVPVIWNSPNCEKPIYIPEGTVCMYSFYHMHRRVDLWGPDAHQFDPDRFLDERLRKYLLKNNFIYLPFNAGPRICPGQQFAYNEVSIMLVHLVQAFSEIFLCQDADPRSLPPADWALGGGRESKEKICVKSYLTLHVEHGCWVKMTEPVAS